MAPKAPSDKPSRKTTRKPAAAPADVDAFLASLDHPLDRELRAVRRVVLAADPRVAEEIKWNAPSFRTSEHFATFHLRAKGCVQIILHLGAKQRAGARVAVADPTGLLEWLGPNRATVKLRDLEEIAAKRVALTRVLRAWIAHLDAPASSRAKEKPSRARPTRGGAGKETSTIDGYLEAVRPDQRAALEKLRKVIEAAAPGCEACISYGLPAFRRAGRLLVAFGAAPRHCAFYPMSGSIVAAFAAELEERETSKGTIRFQPDDPLPAALVRKIVKARIAENAGGAASGVALRAAIRARRP